MNYVIVKSLGLFVVSKWMTIGFCRLPVCGLTEACCGDLVAVLTSEKSHLRVLELRGNAFHDQGLRKLSHALGSPHCKLQELQYVL